MTTLKYSGTKFREHTSINSKGVICVCGEVRTDGRAKRF